jgi:hypothetical protein
LIVAQCIAPHRTGLSPSPEAVPHRNARQRVRFSAKHRARGRAARPKKSSPATVVYCVDLHGTVRAEVSRISATPDDNKTRAAAKDVGVSSPPKEDEHGF